jgi:subtilase family serine protease
LSGSLNVSNTGAVPANNVIVNVYLSSNSTYELGDTLIASLYYGTIGGKITKVKSFAVSTKTNPRGKYVIGVIDPSNIVIESNETNNSALKLVP